MRKSKDPTIRKVENLLEKIQTGDTENYYTLVSCTIAGKETVAVCQQRKGDFSCALAPVFVYVTPDIAKELYNDVMGTPE